MRRFQHGLHNNVTRVAACFRLTLTLQNMSPIFNRFNAHDGIYLLTKRRESKIVYQPQWSLTSFCMLFPTL